MLFLSISAWVRTIGASGVPLIVTSMLSPAFAVAGTLIETSIGPFSSALLMKPSLFASSAIVTIGAPGAVSCRRAVSLTGPALLPAASTIEARATKSVLLPVGLNETSM